MWLRMDRDLACGLLWTSSRGWGVLGIVPDGFVAMGTAAVYAGTSYFYFAFDVSLLGEAVRFDDRVDRVGYAIGLFG